MKLISKLLPSNQISGPSRACHIDIAKGIDKECMRYEINVTIPSKSSAEVLIRHVGQDRVERIKANAVVELGHSKAGHHGELEWSERGK